MDVITALANPSHVFVAAGSWLTERTTDITPAEIRSQAGRQRRLRVPRNRQQHESARRRLPPSAMCARETLGDRLTNHPHAYPWSVALDFASIAGYGWDEYRLRAVGSSLCDQTLLWLNRGASMLLISIDELIAHLPLLPGEKLYKLFVAPSGFAMVAKATARGWIAYRIGTFHFFGANKEVMHYREFAGIRRSAELFDAFAARYQALAEESDIDWIVQDLQAFPTVEEQWAHLVAQGYVEG